LGQEVDSKKTDEGKKETEASWIDDDFRWLDDLRNGWDRREKAPRESKKARLAM
jgi:hypothetical protein